MKPTDTDDLAIAPTLAAEIRAAAAAAAAAHHPAREIVQEAVEGYLAELRARPRIAPDASTRSVIVARMLKRRSQRPLSKGLDIEDVIAWGCEGRA